MPRAIEFVTDFETDDWVRGDIFVVDGVLGVYLTLKVRGRVVVQHGFSGANNSAISLLRSARSDHRGATDSLSAWRAEWPLFFCAGGLANTCGVISDFSVEHQSEMVLLSGFYECAVPFETTLTLRWTDWARAVVAFGEAVARRLPREKRGVKRRVLPKYRRFRRILKRELVATRLMIRERAA